MILDKEALQYVRDQLVERLPILEAKFVQMGELEALLEQKKQEKIAYSQEVTQLHAELAQLKFKWAELHDAITLVVEYESASMKRITNLKANLRSKTKEATATEEKMTKKEERLRKVME